MSRPNNKSLPERIDLLAKAVRRLSIDLTLHSYELAPTVNIQHMIITAHSALLAARLFLEGKEETAQLALLHHDIIDEVKKTSVYREMKLKQRLARRLK